MKAPPAIISKPRIFGMVGTSPSAMQPSNVTPVMVTAVINGYAASDLLQSYEVDRPLERS